MNIIFLDTETTDLSPDARLVQLAYKDLESGKVVNEFFKPPVPISFGAMSVHHVTHKMVADKPAFQGSACAEDLRKDLQGKWVIAHNAPFDIQILKNEGIEVEHSINTLRLAQHLIESEQYKLQYLRYFLELEIQGQAHDAMGDVLVLEALFYFLTNVIKEKFGLTADEDILKKMKELDETPVLQKTFTFGKYKGETFEEVAGKDLNYLEWLFNSETQKDVSKQNEDFVYTLKYYLSH